MAKVFNEEQSKIMKLLERLKLRHLMSLILLSFFIWWCSRAIIRFWSQPLSTDISFSFGDNKTGIQFPLVTLCQYHFTGDFFRVTYLLQCCS